MCWQQDSRYIDLQDKLNKINKPTLPCLCAILSDFKDFLNTYDVKLIFIADKNYGVNFNTYCNQLYNEHSFTLFENQNLVFLDKTLTPNQTICLMYGIFLDTNFTSMINNKKEKYKRIIQDIKNNEDFRYIHSHYIVENIINCPDKQSFLEAVEPTLQQWCEIDSTNTDEIREYLHKSYDDKKERYLLERNRIYAAILKAVIIQKTSSKSLPIEKKFERYFEFINNELCRLDHISSVFTYLYFKNEKLKIFNKLNIDDSKKLLENISNTTLDLMFLNIKSYSYCEYIQRDKKLNNADFFLPFFATDDNGLREFGDYIKWKGLLEINGEIMPVYANSYPEIFKYCSNDYHKRLSAKVDYSALINQLENELKELISRRPKSS